MSNTSTVSPYESTGTSSGGSVGGGLAAACVIGAVTGAVTVARWLTEETSEDRAAVQARREERRRELLRLDLQEPTLTITPDESLSLSSVSLHQREVEPLVRAAEQLGYRREPLVLSAGRVAESPILLCGSRGERLAIMRNRKGTLDIATRGEQTRIHAVVRQQSADRVREYLRAKGSVRSHQLPNGEVQFQAQEHNVGQPGGQAVISVQVRQDGTLWTDIDRLRGPRCQELVAELAQAVGGQVVETAHKEAFYQLPGEPTKTRVRL